MSNSKRFGNNFELLIKNINNSYLQQYIAEIYKENDSREYREKLRVDFTGWTLVYDYNIFNAPIPIGVECKSIGINKLKKSNIKKHQLNYLKRLALAGGIALILVQFRKFDRIIRINITKKDVIENRNFIKLYKEKKFFSFDDLSKIGKVLDTSKNIDYLGAGDNNKISFFKKYEVI